MTPVSSISFRIKMRCKKEFKDNRNSGSDKRERVKGSRQGSTNGENGSDDEIANSDIAYGM